MKMRTIIKSLNKIHIILFFAEVVILFTSCERRSLEDEFFETALIPVKIDWSKSGIPVSETNGSGFVNRVSIRFFPTDGSPAFDRYLNKNIIEGEIAVPVGEYSVIIFNESIEDIYWDDAIMFSDINSYKNFSATIKFANSENYPFYSSTTDEKLIVEPLLLSSWSLDTFKVTEEMVLLTRGGSTTALSSESNKMINALTNVVMRHLTYNVTVKAKIKNLVSAQLIQGALRGFAGKVYLASALTEQVPVTYVFKLNNRKWDNDTKTNGTVSKSFLSFGRLPQSEEYWLNMDVIFVTGEKYNKPLLFDITNKVMDQSRRNINIDVDIDFELPFVEGGIDVGDWDDEEIVLK